MDENISISLKIQDEKFKSEKYRIKINECGVTKIECYGYLSFVRALETFF